MSAIRKQLRTTIAAMLAALPVLAEVPNQCIECHQSDELYSRYPKLHRYYQEWVGSVHSQKGVTCNDCHRGQAGAGNAELAHTGIYPVGDPNSSLHFTNQPETCGACHDDKQRDFEESKHYGALMEGATPAPTCTTCHPAMNKRPTYQLIVLNACGNCHGPGNQGDLPDIVDAAQDMLRHLNMAEGLMGWTRLHFSSHDWPGESRADFRKLEQRYADIVSQVHRFRLSRSEESTMSLLSDLRNIFETERKASRDEPAGAGAAKAESE